jgi:hypothetical protein
MKKLLFALSLFALVVYWSGCKKCYNCHNSCLQCDLSRGGHTFTQVICNDSFATVTQFSTAVSADTTAGWVCTSIASTYSYDFCSNKPGTQDDYYINYYNEGGRATCTPK